MSKGRRMVSGNPAAAKPRKGHDVAALFAQAMVYDRMGRAVEAQALYREILKERPDHFDTLHQLGISEYQSGQVEAAARSIGRAVLIDPQSAAAHSNLATVLLALRRHDEALACCDKAIALKVDYADAHFNRGIALDGLKRFEDAVQSFETAIRFNPRHADAFNNLGNALHRLGRFRDAIARYDEAIRLRPGYVLAFNNRGAAYKELMQTNEALADFDRALALAPGHAGAWTNRGEAMHALRRFDEAQACHDRALSISPRLAQAWLGRGNVLMATKRGDEALAACERALAIEPDSARALTQIGQCHAMRGDAQRAVACFDAALAIKPDEEAAISNKIFTLDFSAHCGFAQHQEVRSEWWRRIGLKLSADAVRRHDNDRDPARRIMLGYVSSDFIRRSTAYAIRPVLQNHDKTQFEVICYSGTPTQDAVTESFRQIADHWRDISQWPDDRLADCVRADKVDILIDLSGHSRGNRLSVFARKPAPVQVTAWGHMTGTGLPTIDYLFSDPVLIPASVRGLFAERIHDLPIAMIIEPPPVDTRSSEPSVLSNGHVTYGVFNRVSKISDAAVAVWSGILRSDATARLLVKDGGLDNASVRSSLLKRFEAHGISSDRITLLGSTPRAEHLAAYRQVDICLDPFPQGGGVSTWEALYMGVPVVAKLGDSVPARLAGGILAAIGMTDWVAEGDDQYAAIALRSTPDQLRAIRHDLPGRIDAHCSPAAYTLAVEQAYRAMWESYCRTPDV